MAYSDSIPTTWSDWKGEKVEHAVGRVVVKPMLGAGDDLATAADKLICDLPTLSIHALIDALGIAVFAVPDDADIVALASELEARPDVTWAEPDMIDQISAVTPNPGIPNDPDYRFSKAMSRQWSTVRIRSQRGWAYTTGSKSVVLGIIDSGIALDHQGNLNHPDLMSSRIVLGKNYVSPGSPPRDQDGHGTFVAGIAAADTNNEIGIAGVDWTCTVYICKVLGRHGGTGSDFAQAVTEIMGYAHDHGMTAVINFSSGNSRGSKAGKAACKAIAEKDMMLCASSGNEGIGILKFPAGYSLEFSGNIVAVGATDETDRVFSNWGRGLDIVAPGENVLSTYPPYLGDGSGYEISTGSSAAAPYVAATLALIRGANPSLSGKEALDLMQRSCSKLVPLVNNVRSGQGRLEGWGPEGRPAVLLGADKFPHIFYTTVDQAIYELWWDLGWKTRMLAGDGATTGAPRAAGDPAAHTLGPLIGVTYRDLCGNLWLISDEGGAWSAEQMTSPNGATKGPLACGDPCASIADNFEPHITYRGPRGELWDLYYQAVNKNWLARQIENQPSPANGNPTTIQLGSQFHIGYLGADANIWDTFFSRGRWDSFQLTGGGETDAPRGVGDPEGWTFLQDQFHFSYMAADGNLWDVYFAGRWLSQQLTGENSLTKAPRVYGRPSALQVFTTQSQSHVVYRACDQNIWDVWYDSKWHKQQLTGGGLTDAPTATGPPTTVGIDGNQSVTYRALDGNLWTLLYAEGQWTAVKMTGGGLTAAPKAGGMLEA